MAEEAPKVWVYNPSGRVTQIEQEQLSAALTKGYALPESEDKLRADKSRQDIADEQSGALGQVGGFIEGAIDAGTLGGYSLLAAQDASPEALAKMQARRETTGGQLGEVAGTVVPAVASGGALAPAGLAARGAAQLGKTAAAPVARALGGGTAGKVLAKGVELGVEGATMAGIDQARRNVTEMSLADEELVSEKVLADVPEAMGYGAALGGILGLGGGAVAEGAKKLVRGGKGFLNTADAVEDLTAGTIGNPIGNDTVQGVVQGISGVSRVAKGIKKSPIMDKAIDAYVDAVGAARGVKSAERRVLKDTLKSPSARKDFLARGELRGELAKRATEKATKARKALDDIDAALPTSDEIASTIQRSDEAIVQAKARAQQLTQRVDELAASADELPKAQAGILRDPVKRLQVAAESGDAKRIFRESSNVASELADVAAKQADPEIQRYADELRAFVDAPEYWGAATTHGKTAAATAEKTLQTRRMLSELLDTEGGIESHISRLKSVDDEAQRTVLNAIQDQADSIDELIGNSSLDARRVKKLEDAKGKLLELHSSLAEAGERIAPTNVLDDVIRQEEQGFFGQYPMAAALATGVVLGPGAYVGARAVNTLAKPGTLASQVAAVESIAERVKRMDLQMSRAIKAAVGVAKPARATVAKRPITSAAVTLVVGDREKKQKAFKKVQRNIEMLTTQPQQAAAAVQRITSGIHGLAPSLSGAVARKHAQTVQYLAAEMPRPPSYMMTKRDLDAWEPSAQDITVFGRKYRAVTEPLTIIDDIRDGELSIEAVEALKATRPRLYQEMRTMAMRELFEADRAPNYNTTVQLSILFDFPGDATLTPEFLQRQAQRFAEAEQQQQGPSPSRQSPAPNIAGQSELHSDQVVANL